MTETVTLEVPSEVMARARAEATRTKRRAEEVLVEWASGMAPADTLPDADLLALCAFMMPEAEQKEMSELLWKQREQEIGAAERARLDELLGIYQRGNIRKAEALRVAVSRGLIPPLGAA